MKKILFLLFCCVSVCAQNEPQLEWAFSQSDYTPVGGEISINESTKDISGNTYYLGTFRNTADFDPSTGIAQLISTPGNSDMFIAKYDNNGNYLWAKSIGGSGAVTGTAMTIGGGFIYIAGNFTGTVDFDTATTVVNLTSSGSDIFMARYDLNGIYVNAKSIGGGYVADIKFYNDQVVITGQFGGAVDFDTSVNVYNLTSSSGYANWVFTPTWQFYNGSDAYLAKYSIDFSLLFAIKTSNGIFDDKSDALVIDTAGNLVVTNRHFYASFGPGGSFMGSDSTYILKYDNQGNLIFSKNIGAPTNNGYSAGGIGEQPRKLALDTLNNIFISGLVLNAVNGKLFFAKYDSNGNDVWSKQLKVESLRGIAVDDFNNLFIIGSYIDYTVDFDPGIGVANLDLQDGMNYLAKYDSNGSYIYVKPLNASPNAVSLNNDNSVYISGSLTAGCMPCDLDPSANADSFWTIYTNAFFSKFANDGTYIYSKQLGKIGVLNSESFAATDSLENVYKVGTFSGTTDLDPSLNVVNAVANGWADIYINKYSSSGNFIWGKTINSAIVNTILGMNTDSAGNTYIIGGFVGIVDFDPSGGIANLTSRPNLFDTFIAKYDSNGNYLWVKLIKGSFKASKTIDFDNSGNFYFMGHISGVDPIDFDPSPSSATYLTPIGQQEVVFFKFSPSGNLTWVKQIKGVTISSSINENHIYVNDESVIITGDLWDGCDFNTNAPGSDIFEGFGGFIARYNLNGDFQVAYKLNEQDGQGYVSCGSVTTDSNNNLYLAVHFSGTVNFDFSGTSSYNLTSTNGATAICKYTPIGSLVWAKVIESSDFNSGIDQLKTYLCINIANQLIITSNFSGSIDFDPSANESVLTSSQNSDNYFDQNGFVAKYGTNTGNFLYANKFTGPLSIINSAILANNKLLLSGEYKGAVNFNLASGSNIMTSSSSAPDVNDTFVARFSDTTLGLEETNGIPKSAFVIYPNPASKILYVYHPTLSEYEVTTYDLLGKILNKATLTNEKGIDVSAYPSGIYFIEVFNKIDSQKNTYKMIKN